MISAGSRVGILAAHPLDVPASDTATPPDSLVDLALGVLVVELRLQRDVLRVEVTDARWDGEILVGHASSLRRQASLARLFELKYRSFRKRIPKVRKNAKESTKDAAEP